MLTRINRAAEKKDKGFTLIELLVVIIIIGILSAIAIPLFLNQRKKAVDTAARSDVSTIGKELAAYYVDGTGAPTIAEAGGRYTMTAPGSGATAVDLGRVSDNISYGGQSGSTNLDWCVYVNIATGTGTLTSVEYSAANGIENDGTC